VSSLQALQRLPGIAVSATGSGGEGREVDCIGRQETLLAAAGQVGDPLYSNTREAVLSLKRPIRGKIGRSHIEPETHQSIMMATWYIKGVMDDEGETRIIN
jgi:hypothetical protein